MIILAKADEKKLLSKLIEKFSLYLVGDIDTCKLLISKGYYKNAQICLNGISNPELDNQIRIYKIYLQMKNDIKSIRKKREEILELYNNLAYVLIRDRQLRDIFLEIFKNLAKIYPKDHEISNIIDLLRLINELNEEKIQKIGLAKIKNYGSYIILAYLYFELYLRKLRRKKIEKELLQISLNLFEKALSIYPDNIGAVWGLVIIYGILGRYLDALNLIKTVRKHTDRMHLTALVLGRIVENIQNLKMNNKAIFEKINIAKLMDEFICNYLENPTLLCPAEIFEKVGDLVEDPYGKFLVYFLSLILYLKSVSVSKLLSLKIRVKKHKLKSIYDKMYKLFISYIKSEAPDLYDLLYYEVYIIGGYIYYLNKLYRDSLNLFEAIKDEKEAFIPYDYIISLYSENIGRHQHAIEIADNILDKFPDIYLHRILYLKANAHLRNAETLKNDEIFPLDTTRWQDELEKAILTYLECLRLNPYHQKAANNLVVAYILSGRYNDAYNFFRNANDVLKRNHKLWYNYAIVMLCIGSYNEALMALNKAIEINNRYKKPRELLQKIQESLRRKSVHIQTRSWKEIIAKMVVDLGKEIIKSIIEELLESVIDSN